MNNQPNTTTPAPDPLAQAGEILRRFAAGESISPITMSVERAAAITLASVAYAQALELRRIGDALESLVEARHCDIMADDLVAIVAASDAARRVEG